MERTTTLSDYVMRFAERGACRCGKCVDAPENPDDLQPANHHTVNLTFFEVAAREGARPEELRALVEKEHPDWLDGGEHNYIVLGAEMGDQGLALMTIGLGDVLGVWKALSPDTLLPFLDEGTKQTMAGSGFVALQAVAS